MRNGTEITTGKRALWIAWGIFALHTAGLVLLFDPISGLFNAKPLIEQDYGLHYHHLLSMQEFWKTSHRLWGYSPLFMAGYPCNTVQDASIKLFEILAIFAPGVDSILAFKWIVFLCTACIPWMIYGAARAMFEEGNAGRKTSITAMILGTAYWWNSYPREMFFFGMVGFPAAAYLGLFSFALFARMVRSPDKFGFAHAAWIASAVLLLPMHPQGVAAIVIPCSVILAARFRNAANASRWSIAAGIILTLALNAVWLAPFIAYRGDDISRQLTAEVPFFVSADPLTFIKDYIPPDGYFTFRTAMSEKGLRLVILFAGAAGLARMFKTGSRLSAFAIGSGALSLFLLAYFGSYVSFFRAWQPLRFKIAMDLFLILGAANWIPSALESGVSIPKRAFAISALILGAASFLSNLISTESRRGMTMRTEPPPEVVAIANWIRNSTTGEGRILFEESGEESGYYYGGMYPSAFLAHWTNRQFVGGPANFYNDRHHFAEFHSGRLFQRPIMEIPDDQLRSLLQTYNIEAIIAFSHPSINRFSAMKELVTFDGQIGGIALMKVHQPLNWFVKGEGRAEVIGDFIHCSNVKADEVVLKYHWIQGLTISPSGKLGSANVGGPDPISFIRITAPPSDFVVALP